MFKLSLAVFTYLFTYGCCANRLEQSPDEETEETIKVPSVNETDVGDGDNLGERDFDVNQPVTLQEKPATNYREGFKEEDQKAAKTRQRRAVCGRRTYNPRFYMCCAGTIQSRPGFSPACCGTRSYDTRTRMCCAGTIQSRPGFSPACCGTRSYDTRTRMCCAGTIQSRPGFSPACCGTRSYDTRTRMCCAGTIQSRPGFRPACCGTRAYDATFRQCCGGQIC